MTWTPIHSVHSIERTKIGIQFAERLPSKILAKLGEGFDKRREEFHFGPRTERLMATITLTDNPQDQAVRNRTSPAGWQFVREDTPGVPIEAFVLDPNGIAYEMAQYTRWAPFFERFGRIADDAIASILETIRVNIVVLEYFDRFIFRPEEQAEIRLPMPHTLLKSELSSILSDEAQNGSELWHLHRGWFEGKEPTRFLVNQNIDAQHVIENDTQLPSVMIFTKIEQRNPGVDLDLSALKRNLDVMHNLSKKIVQSALVEDVSRKIGLIQ